MLQARRDPRRRERVEAHVLAARGDRREHVLAPVGDQHQMDERRRLLERLQHPVRRLVVHRIGPLDHEHAPRGFEWRARRGSHHRLLDVSHEHFRGAARRHPGEVGVRPARDPFGHRPRLARAVGEQRGGKRPGDCALAGPRRTVEQIGVRRPACGCDRGHQHRACVRVRVESGQDRRGVGGGGDGRH